MRILVTGSRTWTDRAVIRQAIVEELASQGGTRHVIVHGGALGADSYADAIARELELVVECHPADWTGLGKRAGYVRNAEMVATNPDVCLAFIENESKGATMCASLAEASGIRTLYFTK